MRNQHPCHAGCGEETRGPKGTICRACLTILANHAEHQRRLRQGSGIIWLPDRWVHAGHMGDDDKLKDRIEAALIAIFNSLGRVDGNLVPSPTHHADSALLQQWGRPVQSLYAGGSVPRVVPVSAAQAYADLTVLIHLVCRDSHKAGKARGSNLLAQLAAGALTSDDFERHAGITNRSKS